MTYALVTGGAGYIGSHTCKALAKAGYTPVVYDNLIHGNADAVKWGPFEYGDILDQENLDRVFARYRPVCVMHFAAFAYVGESVADPSKYYVNNISGSISLLEATRRNGVSNFVFSSSCATYGQTTDLPIREESEQRPISPYGETKLVVEHALRDYGRAYGLRWAAMRYFNAAGCDDEGILGERHIPETHAIPLAIEAALRGGTFHVFGTDYGTLDGTAIRDYVHVEDLADAHVLAARYLESGGQSQAFNLAMGTGISVTEMLEAVSKSVGKKIRVAQMPRRPGDPPILYASAEKAKRILGWQPRHTGIDTIVDTAVRWARAKSV